MKHAFCLFCLLAGLACPLFAQDWTPEDSLRLRRLLEGDGEIRLNPHALKELEQSFGQPKASEEKPWLKFDETLPGVVSREVRKILILRPYTGYTPYNWDPIRQCKIDIDKPTWQENVFRGFDKLLIGVRKPSGRDFTRIFTKEFWNRNIKKRRSATLEALRSYGDSIAAHEKYK